MKMFKKIIFIIILISMSINAREAWNTDPDYRTYRATAYINVEDLSENGVPNISGSFHFNMIFEISPGNTEQKHQSGSFTTDQDGLAFVELFITVPIEYPQSGSEHVTRQVYISGISGELYYGLPYIIESSNNTSSHTSFSISPAYVLNYSDDDGIPDVLEIQLAEKFKPVLHRHPHDRQQNLENIETLMYEISQTELKAWNVAGDPVGPWDFPPIHHRNQYNQWNSFGTGTIIPSYEMWQIDFNITKSTSYTGASVGNRPLYFHVFKNENYYYVQYWYFFTMNDVRGDTKNDTWHEGDWEHVGIKLNDNFEPLHVNFYQHYGGHTKSASQCWWSSSNATSSTPQQGFSSSRTHLHIWISKNGHASYNKNDLVYRIQVDVLGSEKEDFKDQCDYTTSQSFFEYDFMEKLGEIEYKSSQNGYYWKGNSKEWLPFVGYVGDYYWSSFFSQGTHSPRMPAFRRGFYSFTINSSTHGFGNGEDNWAVHLNPIYGLLGIDFGPKIPVYFWDSDISWEINQSGL